ncbi:MAG TPA: radical SAM protein [Anaerolineaceae bacterium]|nr:radical SAM protein [Anaerolineaceae bacterium]
MIAFGPVPSRRLGYSLGINHIPAKYCTYSCVYCQVGRTTHMPLERQEFYAVDQILTEVGQKVTEVAEAGKKIDYLTLVPDGEPTLDINLGKVIGGLKQFGIPVAVISNASLIDRLDVQEELMQADWVSLKVDSVDESVWRRINRPHRRLSLPRILEGMFAFKQKYSGKLVTESMLVAGLNDNEKITRQLCDFLLKLQPSISYLSIPTRPPAEVEVRPPSPEALQEIIEICAEKVPFVDLLFESEVGDFVSTGNLVEDILSITAVHPLREEPLRAMVSMAGGTWQVVEDLLADGSVLSILYRNERYFFRRFGKLGGKASTGTS